MSRYHCDDCDHTFDAPTDTETCRCGCGERAWREEATDAIRPTRTEIAEQIRVVRAAGDDVDALLAAAQPDAGPREADNPAAYALACHIADHPISTVQAAFRYLNAPLTLEARDRPPAGQNLRDRIAQAALHAVGAALGDTLTPSARGEALAGIAAVLPSPADEAPPLLAEVWTVWREDEPVWGHFATEDTGKTGTIDYYEEQEERCPDYGWRQDGPRLELLAGGETTGIYLSRHPVYGKPAPADRAAEDAKELADLDREGAELVCVDECGSCDACGFETFGTPAEGWREAARFLRRTPRDSADFLGAIRGARLIEAELRRMVDEAQQVGEGRG
jgi:hypothetical protein